MATDTCILVQDDDGLHWTPGKCDCDFELAEAIMDIIAEGLEELSSVLVSHTTQKLTSFPTLDSIPQPRESG